MAANNPRKVLRIGIVQDEQIVQEQLIREPENVTVGESTKNTFVLPPCSLPKRFPLFVAKGDFFTLGSIFDQSLSKINEIDEESMNFDGPIISDQFRSELTCREK